MQSRIVVLSGLIVALLAGTNCFGDEHEQHVRLNQVPEAVKAAARGAIDGVELEEAQVEAVLIYELEGTAEGQEYEIEITADGQVVEIESEAGDTDDACVADDDGDDDNDDGDENEEEEDEGEHELDIPLTAVPARVLAAAREAVAGIELKEAEVESVLVYEFEGEVGEKEYEIEVTADGKVIETEEDED